MLLIESTDRLYWDGESFGPVQKAVSFRTVEDLPLMIKNNHDAVLCVQVINEYLPIVCYHNFGDGIGALAVPDNNVTLVTASAVMCPNCDGDMLLYQIGDRAMRFCLCEYCEEV